MSVQQTEEHRDSETAAARIVPRFDANDARRTVHRASVGRTLVAVAVFAPAMVVLSVYLVLQGRLYGYHVPGPKWPWIAADLALLLIGILLMRGEDL